MRLPTFAVLGSLLPLATAGAADPALVKIEHKDGSLVAPITRTHYQTVEQQVTEVAGNGIAVTRVVKRLVPVQVTEYAVLKPEVGDFYTPAGEPIDPKKLADVLKVGSLLAVSADGKPPIIKANKEVVAGLVPKGTAAPDPTRGLAEEKPFVSEAAFKDGAVTITRDVVSQQPVVRQEPRKTPAAKATIVMEPVTQRVIVALDAKGIELLTLAGKTIPAADWADVLGSKAKVIVSPGGKAVPDELMKANKDAVAVIIIKPTR